ncbi:MAG: MBL fold metallo-hydrolase, partial [Deltaproteobacteria bacterium]|nr:MBL fold metallo-hydrolase [Deltaproteobacteria bacterium]
GHPHQLLPLGQGALGLLVDPASPYDDEQYGALRLLDALIATGERPAQVFLTHHHMDHAWRGDGALAALLRLCPSSPTPARRSCSRARWRSTAS